MSVLLLLLLKLHFFQFKTFNLFVLMAKLSSSSSSSSSSSTSSVPVLFVLARFAGVVVTCLALCWGLYFQSSFLPHSPRGNLIYSVLHPLSMVIGFIVVSGEAILVHRWLPGSKGMKKFVHLGLQGVALACGIFGIWTVFHGDDGVVANFYSLHSWMGLLCISLFGAQWLIGFLSFWHRGELRTTRAKILPWHIFIGLYTYALAVVTAETGLLEKLTVLQTKRNLPRHCAESLVVNSLGISLVLLGGFVIMAAVTPKHGMLQNLPLYSDKKSASS